ncbi:MAG: cytochrome d ubiquinol oxidase subunit II [Candidatus Acidiferrales bacterium]
METLWFCLVALMLAVYVVLDGFDLGAGIVHLLVARTDSERRSVLGSIGPVWDGNEVWLIAAGGTLYFAFPALYASSFSGFYLPLMIVLWLLTLRGVAVEFRSHVTGAVWAPFWDAVFALASLLLAVFFGAALGNVVRGVPLDANGRFFEALWTNFRPGPDAGVLDWYTILVGLTALAALTLHGALWVALKTDGDVSVRARRLASRAVWLVAALTAAITAASFRVQPSLATHFSGHAWGAVFPALAILGLAGIAWFSYRGAERNAFFGSCAYLLGMLTSAAFSLYPYVLPASTDPAFGLTVHNAMAPEYGLRIGLIWWFIGMALATAYTVHAYRRFAGKVDARAHGEAGY